MFSSDIKKDLKISITQIVNALLKVFDNLLY